MASQERAIGPSHLNEMLSHRHPGVVVETVEVLDDTSGSANRLKLAVTYRDGRSAGLPPTMFVKRNLPRFTFPEEMYSTEVRVYRDILPGSAVEAPVIYAIETGATDAEFTMAMEDLSAREGCRLGFVLEPAMVDEIDALNETLARLHCAHWGAGPSWAALPANDPSMRFWREVGPQLVTRHLQRGHRANLLDGRWSPDELWTGFDALVERNSTGPITFLHGDVHAGNVYHLNGRPGGLFDWQLSLRGCWALDVGYLLTSALSVEERRCSERELLDGYLDRLRSRGVDAPDRDEAWTRYRQNALYGLMMWLITPDGVHTDAAQTEYLRRCVAAVEDLDTLAALS